MHDIGSSAIVETLLRSTGIDGTEGSNYRTITTTHTAAEVQK